MSDQQLEYIDLDLSGAKPNDGSQAPKISAGDYHVRIDKVEGGQSQAGKPKITLWYEILAALQAENEEEVGKKFPASYSADPDKDFSKDRILNLLNAVDVKPTKRGIPVGKMVDSELLISVEHRERTTRDEMTDQPKTQSFQNVCRERPVTELDDSAKKDDDEEDERPRRRRRSANA